MEAIGDQGHLRDAAGRFLGASSRRTRDTDYRGSRSGGGRLRGDVLLGVIPKMSKRRQNKGRN